MSASDVTVTGDGGDGTADMSSKRTIKLTEKGVAYQCNKEKVKLDRLHKRLDNQIVVMTTLLASYENLEKVNHEISTFDNITSSLIESYSEYVKYLDEDEQAVASERMDDADTTVFQFKSDVYTWINKAQEYMESRSEVSRETRSSTRSRRSKVSIKSRHSNTSHHSGSSKRSYHSIAESLKDQKAHIAGLKAEKALIEERRAAETKAEVMLVEQEIQKAEAIATVYEAKEKESASIRKKKGIDVSSRKSLRSKRKVDSEISLLSNSMHQLVKLQSAPDIEIDVFSGDYLEYNYFMATFKEVVESKVDDPMGRLTRLIKFTSGEPKDLIKHCVQEDSASCYDLAKSLLDEQYGNPYRIASAYIKELKQWPSLKSGDSAGFRKFYRFLLKCKTSMDAGYYLRQLDAPDVLRSLQCKLPFSQQDGWNRRVENIRRKQGREATFLDFVNMTEIETRLVNDPVYSREALTEAKEGKIKMGSHLTGMEVQNCRCCNLQHDLDDCAEYLANNLEERKNFLFQQRLCYACYKSTSPGHHAKICREKRTCKICNASHPTGLHNPIPVVKSVSTVCYSNSLGDGTVSMTVVPVILKHESNPDKEVVVYAMLDNCSQGTFINEDVLHMLDVEDTRSATITVKTLNGESTEESTAVDGLIVSALKGYSDRYPSAKSIRLPVAYSRTTLPIDKEDIPTPEKLFYWKHLSSILREIPKYNRNIPVGLLIGGDCPKALEPQHVVPSSDGGPYAFRSYLGWCIAGPIQRAENPTQVISCNRARILVRDVTTNKVANHHFVIKDGMKDLSTMKMLNNMYYSDFNENQGEKDALSNEDHKFLDIMDNGCTVIDGHYQLPLPFRNSKVTMPNNKEQAIRRAESIKRKLQRNEKLHSDYKEFMEHLLTKKYARKVDINNDTTRNGSVWYIPHHAVYHNKKPDKVRVVFDCSASYGGKSLNKELLQGPDLTNKLIGVLVRFRKEVIAFMADIEAMYYQVRVPEGQRSFVRYLWWPGGNLDSNLCEYEMCVHLFGAISSPSCANFALRRTAIDNESKFGEKAKETLLNNFYVDDVLKSEVNTESAVELVENVQDMCAARGFHLTKYTSNDAAFINSVPVDQRAKSLIDYDLISCIPPERALGVHWCIEDDRLGFRVILQNKPLTRRGILSVVSSIYDPLGLVSPFLLPGRKILQEISADSGGWDDKVADDHIRRWEKWIKSLPLLETLGVQRCYKPQEFGKSVATSLHSFSDASTVGYGQASYLRQVNEKGDIHVTLVMGKSRVAPMKPITIPRLELTAATVSVKVGVMLKEELHMNDVKDIYWTDSKIVLGYVANDTRRFRVYVANRVQMIRSHTEKEQWKFVCTDDNPGDMASRGLQLDSEEIHRWFSGPDFLWKKEEDWMLSGESPVVNESDPEVIKVKTVNISKFAEDNHIFTHLLERVSCWHRFKRIVATMKMFSIMCRKRMLVNTPGVSGDTFSAELIIRHIEEAEIIVIKWMQNVYFEKEISTLKKIMFDATDRSSLKSRKSILKGCSIYKLDPFLDDKEILRVGGRLKKSSLNINQKFPILLPKNSKITQLIIRWFHNLIEHRGRHMTLNEIRASGYWIVHGSSCVQQNISKCVRCRFLRGRLGVQKMASLPVERTTSEAPFVYSGVDAFGPFYVKEGRKEFKRYGILFTCFCCRAVHIEKVNNMDTDSFIQALRRFIARRGYVRSIKSDNGTNFVGAETELKRAYSEMNHPKIKNYLLTQGCDWIVWEKNPPYASHMGGVWERQIRTVRSILTSLLKSHTSILDDESLHTFLTEAESIVNSRPLTTDNTSDPNSTEPLTPNHILTMKSKVISAPPGVFQKPDLYCRKRWRRVQYLLNVFWSRWKKEYLSYMQKRQKWNAEQRNFCKGDVVMIKDESLKRNNWPMGRIVETFPDDEGLVRYVDLKTANSDIFRRPIAKLVLLLESDTEDK